MKVQGYPLQLDQERVDALARKCGTYPFFVKAMLHRGYSWGDIEKIINTPEDYLSQELLPGAMEAAKKLWDIAHEDKGEIHVFADYDVDGLTSGYIMMLVIKMLRGDGKYPVIIKYPERSEGYGLSMSYCEKLIGRENPVALVITVDNGITKDREISYLEAHGIDTIVTDHHEPIIGELPETTIVNPCYNYRKRDYLCGAAVAFEVVKALMRLDPNLIPDIVLDIMLSCVALGTVADVMPQSPENLALISLGLKKIDDGRAPLIIKELLRNEKENLPTTAKDLGFTIGPRLNAAGRFNKIIISAQALFSNDSEFVMKSLEKLEEINKERKLYSAAARKEIALLEPEDYERIIFFHGKNYPKGTFGTIAGDMTKKFPLYPCVCYEVQDNNIIGGSFRFKNNDIDLIDIFEKLKKKGLLISYAGHPSAGAIRINLEKIVNFKQCFARLYDSAMEKVIGDDQELTILYDQELTRFSQLDNRLLAILNIVPLMGNNQVLFYMKHLRVYKTREAKSNPNHLQFTFIDGIGDRKSYWLWDSGANYAELGYPKYVDILFHVEQDFIYKDRPMIALDVVQLLASENQED